MSRFRRLVSWAAAALLGLFFVAVGVAKIGSPNWTARFVVWGYPPWLTLVVAAAEVIGGIALLVPRSRRPASIVLMVVMLGATLTHALHGEWPRTIVPIALTALLAAVLATTQRRSSA